VVRAQLEYSVAGSNAVFEKDAETAVTLGSSPLSLTVEGPDSIISGQSFDVVLTVQSNAAAAVDNVVVQGQYPFGYALLQANPVPEGGSTLWRFGTVKPGETKTVRLRGSLSGQHGEQRVFRFSIGSQADLTETTIKVPFLVIPHTLALEQPSVSAVLSLDSETGSTITTQGVVGTPSYMSPEQAQGIEIDGRSDVYGLGVIVYQMLSGQQPYSARRRDRQRRIVGQVPW
jgi:serine/threonine protein kinase